MCGIAGFVQRNGTAEREVLDRQLALMLHRGPDSIGSFGSGRALIGQTRLAVIDLVTGDPPVTNEDGDVGVALNGEIYNFHDLRANLMREGHRFRTTGDTEVLAHLAEDSDAEVMANRLDGMFAFAVWDERRERLWLVRDRLGKKPLYYWSDGQTLVFGSEIKSVLAHPRVPRRLNPNAIDPYLSVGYVPTPDTFYESIYSLPPGHVLTVESDLRVQLRRYWEPPVPGRDGVSFHDLSFSDASVKVRAELERAVRRRLVADVPLGAFLSGGLDSSAVVAIMANSSSHAVKTFTIGFENAEFDERTQARAVARALHTDHEEFVVKPDAAALLEEIVWHCDQPFGDSSALPTYLLSELTRRHVTVALAGDGGDELFAGYDRFRAALFARPLSRLPRVVHAGAGRVLELVERRRGSTHRSRAARFLRTAHLGLPDAYFEWCDFVLDQDRRRRVVPSGAGSDGAMRAAWEHSDGAEPLIRLLDLNLRTYLLDDLLPKVDRMSMAHALEVRSPFLDHHLVELALRLPVAYRLRAGTTKRVLRAAVRDLVPDQVLKRAKQGFGVPLDDWFRNDLRAFSRELLAGRGCRLADHVDKGEVASLLREHTSGAASHGHALWALAQLEVFLRRQQW